MFHGNRLRETEYSDNSIQLNTIQYKFNKFQYNPLEHLSHFLCCGLWNGQHGFDWKAARSLDLPLMHEKHTSLADSSKPTATWMRLQPGDVRLQVVDRYLRFILWSPCPGLGSTWICMTSTTARLTPCKDNMTELDDEHHSSADSADLPTADADAEA